MDKKVNMEDTKRKARTERNFTRGISRLAGRRIKAPISVLDRPVEFWPLINE
jgi:hypothetical protein